VTPPIRLLAVDIDGTLLGADFRISDTDLAALRRAHQLGIEVVLVTGRRHTFALPVAAQIGFDLWLISSNGAVTRSSGGELFHRDLLPADTARRLCTYMRAFRGSTVVTFDKEEKGALAIERFDELTGSIARWIEKNRAFIATVVPLEDVFVTDPIQVMFCGPVARMQEAEQHLAAGGFENEITVLKTQYDARDLTIIDVLNHACSKGHALRRWAEHRGIPAAEIMAIGDNFNDVEMLEYAGIPVIMGNACPELKQNGWRVTASNLESGVAAALDDVLGPPAV
jgi:Cof subfamily protein (haloacid dehalogenase superfamily)